MSAEPGEAAAPSSVYGPVFSWRYGQSLGVDPLLVDSVCSFRCVYCQLGRIGRWTQVRNVYVPTAKMVDDLTASAWSECDVVTFSGSGEPTLAANLGEMIEAARFVTRKPVVVLTNGTMLFDARVREELQGASHVACKLDAPDELFFRRVNRPLPGVTLQRIQRGFAAMREDFSGTLSLQIMVLPTTLEHVMEIASLVARMKPDDVQLSLPSRPVPPVWRLENRGAHRCFDAKRAWRSIDSDELTDFARQVQQRSGVKVLVPPPRSAADEDKSPVTEVTAGA